MRIQAEALSIDIDGRQIFTDVNLACGPGSMTALVGPSGSGKTTLLHCLGLLLAPSTGQVLVDGADTTQWKSWRRRRFWSDHATFVLQDYGVMEEESVEFNVAMRAAVLSGKPVSDKVRLAAALDATGLTGRSDETASHLSGGEKQRLAVARAIYKDASVVFVDEPTASLDAVNRSHIISLFADLAKRGCVVIVATHDDEMMRACDAQFTVKGKTTTSAVALKGAS